MTKVGGHVGARLAEVADPSMAVADEVEDALERAVEVVRENVVRRKEARRSVEEDDRGAGALLGLQVTLVLGGRNNNQAADPARDERGDELALPVRVLVDVAGEHADALLVRVVLDRAEDAGRELVGDILYE